MCFDCYVMFVSLSLSKVCSTNSQHSLLYTIVACLRSLNLMESSDGSRSHRSNLASRISQWQQRSDEHEAKQMINPFSQWEGASHRVTLSKDDPNYGRPVEGSMTEFRGKQAGMHISGEVVELCQVIADLGQTNPDGSYSISFGALFEAYTRISNKLVGMLMRARKQGLLDFKGEMLYQRQDDDVIITCFRVPEVQ